MKRRALFALIAIAAATLVAVESARADGQLLVVTGTGDGAGACSPYPGVPGAFACTTLRAAVVAAGSNDVVGLPSGTYTLSQGELAIAKTLTILGHDARDTFIQGSGSARVINVGAGVTSSLIDVTVSGGRAGSGDGGNILNAGSLLLLNSRVTGGQAINGGGVANTGTLAVTSSLIDHNTASLDGGGIASFGGASPLEVKVIESTVYKNSASTAGGISSLGETGTQVELHHATVAYNTSGQDPAGIRVSGEWTSYGSLVVGNQGDTPANCNVAATATGGDIESGTSCGFSGNSTAGLVDSLADDGGPTQILPIPANSAAKGFVNPCQSANDQRSAPRNASGACDAGAYEQGAVAPPVTGFQLPVATPTPTPTPTPVPQKDATGTIVSGTVLIKVGGKFVPFDPSKAIPNGAEIDVTKGKISLTAVLKPGGKPQTATFYDGIFKLKLGKKTTDLTLSQPLAKCPKKKHSSAHAAARKKPKSRKLWGNGSGSFRTRGQYSAATVRGTQWLVQDSCAGTLTRVKKGIVSVRDNVRRKTIILRAGKHYLAKPRR